MAKVYKQTARGINFLLRQDFSKFILMKQPDIRNLCDKINKSYDKFEKKTGLMIDMKFESGDVKDFFTSCDIPLALSFLKEYIDEYVSIGYNYLGYVSTNDCSLIDEYHQKNNIVFEKNFANCSRECVDILMTKRKKGDMFILLKKDPERSNIKVIPLKIFFDICFQNSRHSYVKGCPGIYLQRIGSPMGSAIAQTVSMAYRTSCELQPHTLELKA